MTDITIDDLLLRRAYWALEALTVPGDQTKPPGELVHIALHHVEFENASRLRAEIAAALQRKGTP